MQDSSTPSTEPELSPAKKRLFFVMAALFFAGLLWLTYFLIIQSLGASHWIDLIEDIDHRMEANSEKFFTNSDGIRSPHEASNIESEDFNIVFLGDSFVYGFLLTNEAFPPPAQLEETARQHFQQDNINVWNFGWTTSSPILSLRLLQDLGEKYQPDLVILAVDMSDYRDDYFYRHMLEGDGIFHYINNYPRSTYLLKQFLGWVDPYTGWHKDVFGYTGHGGYFTAREPMEENLGLYDELYDSLMQLYDYTENTLEVPLVVFIPPRHWQYTDKESPETWENGSFDAMGPYVLENYRYFDSKRSDTPFAIISLLEDFQQSDDYPTTFRKDSHWNKKGAKLAADSIFKHLLENGYLDSLQQ